MLLKGQKLREVSFPVGGIGAGCVGIDGAGRFCDWEIFNRPGKGIRNGCTHLAVRAERGDEVLAVRILNAPPAKDLSGGLGDRRGNGLSQFGWGIAPDTMSGFPHFRSCELDGAFPAAEYRFHDPAFPGEVKLTAWSPFIPGESEVSSLPCAVLEISFTNTTSDTLTYYGIGVLSNPWSGAHAADRVESHGGITSLVMSNHPAGDDPEYGETAFSTDAAECSCQAYLFRGSWRDQREIYARELFSPGPFRNRVYAERSPQKDSGLLAMPKRLAPGESGTVRLVLSWYVPNRVNDWSPPEALARKMADSGIRENRWKNYYASLCSSARGAAERIFGDYDRIRGAVFSFREAIHASTLPEPALAGAAENLAVLVSPSCLRLEDGTFWGWEGVGRERGSCPGTCQHVWNYAQALALLFPDLERSIRESQLEYDLDEIGGLHFRMALPQGIRARRTDARPCVDGCCGEIMKCFREWRISGDTAWLKRLYPKLRRVMEYFWSPENPDRWDPDRSGVVSGRQHHTLDMELFGPSGWLEAHYLGALKAMSVIAAACGDPGFADLCRALFEKGRAWTEAELFNGEYYVQKIDLDDPEILRPCLDPGETLEKNPYWDEEHRELKYQIGDGCSIDSHLGQWYASLYGIGEILSPRRMRSAIRAIYKYNFKRSMRDQLNTWRVFSVDDEGGTVICSWPRGTRKPMIPLPYNTETMTGFEWAAACHAVMMGELRIGNRMAAAIRGRYDGGKRNPWNEIECGSNYARSMAAYAMLQAYSGFSYDMTRGRIGFSPRRGGDFRCFWSLGGVWGTYERSRGEQRLCILHGSAVFHELAIPASAVKLNRRPVPCRNVSGVWSGDFAVEAGDVLSFPD